ncbi:MAG: hypothetical protein J5829_01460 [Lachnospiraceae bacterium]|nr:hypothetical protein [Lachnospiraceae bacterium]
MPRLIREFSDGSRLEHDRGGIDDWCVYEVNPQGVRKPPLDTDYFARLKAYAAKFGVDKTYNDFVDIYERTTREVQAPVLNRIDEIAATYTGDVLGATKLFTILYAAMVSEENYPNTRLGRKIKRLGVYGMLYENMEIRYAANYMRGKPWREINELCRERGF